MTIVDPDLDDRVARLEGLVARLEALGGVDLAAISPTSVNPDGTPGPVAAGELIESAWGNAVVDTLMRRVGVGLTTPSQSIAAGTNPDIAWTQEVYDTDNMHVPNGTQITIPANRQGVYAMTFNLTTTGAVQNYSLVRININPGGAIRQTIIPPGQNQSTTTAVLPLNSSHIITCSFWNGGTGAIFVGCSLDMVRVAM